MYALSTVAAAQSPPDPDYVRTPLFDSYADFRSALDAATGLADPTARRSAIDSLWSDLTAAGQVPFAIEDRVAFLYRGPATSVSWRGDFNGWGEARGVRLGDSDLWIHERAFPSDTRSDYKVFLNGSDWRLDPTNPLRMWGGFGPNSELRMPDYAYPHEAVRRPDAPRGRLGEPNRLVTDRLPHDVAVRVYTPAGYEERQLDGLPTVYVTDGHEYAAKHLGGMTAVLDNLIGEGALAPAIVVFIDPRRPDTGQNVRADLYVDNAGFADFVADELMPWVDDCYRTGGSADTRTILGTSLGGYFSAYLGRRHPEAVHNIVMQSPWMRREMIDAWAGVEHPTQNVLLTGGTLGDDRNSDAMAAALDASGFTFDYRKVNDGHSWGAWRGQLDELLLRTVGSPIPEPSTVALVACGVVTGGVRRRCRSDSR